MTEVIERTELLVPGSALALGALLGVEVPDVENGAELPLLWHWLYLLERPATADLGADGHPVHGVVPTPPEPGRRRMIAGGLVRRVAPLRCGEPATRRTWVQSSVDKIGRQGPFTLVTVRHMIFQLGELVVAERQDIVYRDGAPTSLRSEPAPDPLEVGEAGTVGWEVDTSAPLLFRFSALTYNAHRIHYDRTYAREVEGYPGLVVHGPLQAVLMAEALRREGGEVVGEFEFRFVAPVFDHEGLVVEVGPSENEGARTTSVRTGSGRRSATGRFRPAI